MEQEQPLLALCSFHWKADHVLANTLRAKFGQDRKPGPSESVDGTGNKSDDDSNVNTNAIQDDNSRSQLHCMKRCNSSASHKDSRKRISTGSRSEEHQLVGEEAPMAAQQGDSNAIGAGTLPHPPHNL